MSLGTQISIVLIFIGLASYSGAPVVPKKAGLYSPPAASNAAPRYYWPVSLDSLSLGRVRHTHVEVRGEASYCRTEEDGDRHIKLEDPTSHRFIIAEIIPLIPRACPRIGQDIIVRGISRHDPEHGWYEVHPLESWRSATAGE